MLTKKQAELLDFITEFIKENKISPSYDEMKSKLANKFASSRSSAI